MEAFQSHPGEGGQQGPVQEETQTPTNPALLLVLQLPHPEAAQQEANMEAEQRCGELHVHTHSLLWTPLPDEERENNS